MHFIYSLHHSSKYAMESMKSFWISWRIVCFCVISQLTVNRSVFTAVDVSDQTSAPAGADTQVLFAPEG